MVFLGFVEAQHFPHIWWESPNGNPKYSCLVYWWVFRQLSKKFWIMSAGSSTLMLDVDVAISEPNNFYNRKIGQNRWRKASLRSARSGKFWRPSSTFLWRNLFLNSESSPWSPQIDESDADLIPILLCPLTFSRITLWSNACYNKSAFNIEIIDFENINRYIQ